MSASGSACIRDQACWSSGATWPRNARPASGRPEELSSARTGKSIAGCVAKTLIESRCVAVQNESDEPRPRSCGHRPLRLLRAPCHFAPAGTTGWLLMPQAVYPRWTACLRTNVTRIKGNEGAYNRAVSTRGSGIRVAAGGCDNHLQSVGSASFQSQQSHAYCCSLPGRSSTWQSQVIGVIGDVGGGYEK